MPSAPTLRIHRVLLLSLGLAACTTASGPPKWDKPGVDSAVANQDLSECRIIANRQAQRAYPPYMGPNYAAGTASAVPQQRLDTNRAITESQAFSSCMQSRGYVQRTAPQAGK